VKTWMVTGAAGFIGSNFVRQVLEEEQVNVVGFDALTYAGNLANLAEYIGHPRFHFIRGDICNAEQVSQAMADVDVVVHFAAESHVDRSIMGCQEFLRTNVQGTQVLLDISRMRGVARFVQISTDEVYGSLGADGFFTEQTSLSPNSPYSASKASADMLVMAYHHTYGLPVIITRCSNNYGPYQFPEKLIPLFITNLLEEKKVPVYGDGLNVRDWIHVCDHCRAVRKVIHRGSIGEVYNIGANNEQTNLAITRLILEMLGCDESMVSHVKDRPGHDRRYAIDNSKFSRELEWQPRITFREGLADTIKWYCTHRAWWQQIRNGEYRDYYIKQYCHVG